MTLMDYTYRAKKKDALDHKGIKPLYPVYSMAILWNMNAWDLQLAADHYRDYAVPVDGDALARSEAKRHKNDAAWARLAADVMAVRS
jgi:uncharacterized protein involved in type VI secretion and phage assembly